MTLWLVYRNPAPIAARLALSQHMRFAQLTAASPTTRRSLIPGRDRTVTSGLKSGTFHRLLRNIEALPLNR